MPAVMIILLVAPTLQITQAEHFPINIDRSDEAHNQQQERKLSGGYFYKASSEVQERKLGPERRELYDYTDGEDYDFQHGEGEFGDEGWGFILQREVNSGCNQKGAHDNADGYDFNSECTGGNDDCWENWSAGYL